MDFKQLDHDAVLSLLPDRVETAHKGSFGRLLLLCGSRGYTGAASLAAMGALRSGAGLVYLGVPESVYPILAAKLTEPVVFPLCDENGGYSQAAVRQIRLKLPKYDAVLIGPGMGTGRGAERMLHTVLAEFSGPVVIDADGINILAGHKDIMRGRTAPTILTPHAGEFARIGGDISGERSQAAAQLARDLDAIVLLKGHHTIITDGTACYINPTGNPGMAVGGSGDVLAGMIVSLLGQGLQPLEAAACAAWLHGHAGDVCAERMGQYGMLPSDMLTVLPRLMK